MEEIGKALEKISSEIKRDYGEDIEIELSKDDISGKIVVEFITMKEKILDPREYDRYKKVFRNINRIIEEELNAVYNAIEYGMKINVESEMKARIKPILEAMIFLINRIEAYS